VGDAGALRHVRGRNQPTRASPDCTTVPAIPRAARWRHGARVFQQPQTLHRPDIYAGIGEAEAADLLARFLPRPALAPYNPRQIRSWRRVGRTKTSSVANRRAEASVVAQANLLQPAVVQTRPTPRALQPGLAAANWARRSPAVSPRCRLMRSRSGQRQAVPQDAGDAEIGGGPAGHAAAMLGPLPRQQARRGCHAQIRGEFRAGWALPRTAPLRPASAAVGP
jgi:hypothetical protein